MNKTNWIALVISGLASFHGLAAETNFYVRGDGLGSDSYEGTNWGRAFATIQRALTLTPYNVQTTVRLQATAPGQAATYDVASRSFLYRGYTAFIFRVRGGWESVDSSPSETGASVIEDKDGTTDERGIDLYEGDHGLIRTLDISRCLISNVTDGVRIQVNSGSDSADMFLLLNQCSILAGRHGVQLDYPKDSYNVAGYGGYAQFHLTNVSIQAGLTTSGHGVYVAGIYLGSGIDATTGQVSTVSSARGDGIRLLGTSSDSPYTANINRTIIHDCARDGIYIINRYGGTPTYTAIRLSMDNCTLANNASNGIQLVTTAAGSWLNATDSIIAGSGALGARLGDAGYANFSFPGGYGCYDDTIQINGATAALNATDISADPIFFTRRDKPYPYYRLAHSGSPCANTDSTGGNRGAYQDPAPGRGTVVVFR